MAERDQSDSAFPPPELILAVRQALSPDTRMSIPRPRRCKATTCPADSSGPYLGIPRRGGGGACGRAEVGGGNRPH